MSFDNSLTRLSSSESVSSPLRKKSILALANTRETTETVLVCLLGIELERIV